MLLLVIHRLLSIKFELKLTNDKKLVAICIAMYIIGLKIEVHWMKSQDAVYCFFADEWKRKMACVMFGIPDHMHLKAQVKNVFSIFVGLTLWPNIGIFSIFIF